MVALTQLEVAQRLVAAPGSKVYAAISVLVQFWCKVKLLRKVPPGAFTPPPNVHSGLILFERQVEPTVKVANRELFFKVARSSFGKRRKTLRNALLMSAGLDLDAGAGRTWMRPFGGLGILGQRRGETLSLQGIMPRSGQCALGPGRGQKLKPAAASRSEARMCGIVGFVGEGDAVPMLLGGLKRLEYRGYDSAGLACVSGGKLELRRAVGKLGNLEKLVAEQPD